MNNQSIRAQYHFRHSKAGLQAWDVRKLIERSAQLPVIERPLQTIQELDEPYWHAEATQLTAKNVADHAGLIHACDLSFPIILCHEGRLMDGMHRVCKAYLDGLTTIKAVQFPHHIAPDSIGKSPDELPY